MSSAALPPENNGFATSSLLLGTVAFALTLLALAPDANLQSIGVVAYPITILSGVLAIVFGIIGVLRARRRGKMARAVTGLVLGSVAILVPLVTALLVALLA